MSRSHLFSWKLSRPGKIVRKLSAAAVSAALLVSATAHGEIKLEPIGTYATGQFDESAAEIPAFDPQEDRLFVVNANKGEVDVLDLSDPTNPSLLFSIEAKDPNADEVNSVAVSNGLVALAIAHDTTGQNGWVEVYNSNLDEGDAPVATYPAGALPDMVTFTPDGLKILAANEGETDGEDNDPRDSEFTVNPEGSVTVIDITNGAANGDVSQIGFTDFNGQETALRDSGVLIWPGDDSSSPNSFSTDVEPEYIAVSPDGSTAFVALQENNAVAKVDLTSNTVTDILPLGFKDHSLPGNEIDASDRDDGINIRNWPIFGMYMPDAIATYEVGGTTYFVTANEGDARGDDGVETERLKKIDDFDLELDPDVFPNANDLLEDENLGRLEVRFVRGDTDGDDKLEEIYAYGGRSFSIYDENGNQVFDSGSQFEQLTAGFLPPETFNSNNDENDSFESRSDAKGPEPEGVTIAEFGGRILAFILLERVGGIMVYDISLPAQAEFVTYVNNRDFDPDLDAEDQLDLVGDLGPEGAVFIDPADSPNGQPLLIVANEVSGTTTIYQVEENYFPQSVASGDPRPDSVILWTRVEDPAVAGDIAGVQLEVATDPGFGNIVTTRNALVAAADHDHCIKVRIDGLSAYTTYYYRFLYKGTATNTGRTRTAPAPGADVPLSFAHLNCQDYVGRYYNTLADLAQNYPDLDFIVHVGDYVYETTGDPQFQNNSDVRGINFTDGQAIDLGGFAAANSLHNYRALYKTYRKDPALRRVHELYPFITIWDDHEFSDDHWQTTATYTDGLDDENQPARKRNAEQAFFEFIPNEIGLDGAGNTLDFDITQISPTTGSTPVELYGSYDFGANLSIFLSDSRSYRPDHLIPEDAFPGTVIASASDLSLPEILDPFVNFEDDLSVAQQATLEGIVTTLAQGAGLSGAQANNYVAANLTGDLSVTYLNALFDGAGQAGLLIDPSGRPTGLTFISMGKQDLFSDIGSRYGVVQDLYEIYAALPGTNQNVLGDAQLAQFQNWIGNSTAGCNIFAGSVSFTPTVLDLSTGFDILPPEFQQKISLNVEHWAGFPAQRQTIIDELAQNNGVIISGDIHASFVSEHGNTAGDATVPEFTGTSVSSESFQEVVEGVASGLLGEGQEVVVEGLLAGLDALLQFGALATPSYNSVIVEAETRVNGYVVTHVDSGGLVAGNHHIDTDEVENNYYEQPGVAAADLPEFTRQAYQVEAGGGGKGEVVDLFTLQILHASDLEGGVDALDRAPVFGSLVERFESRMPNTIVLSAGDNFIPGPFYNAAGDRATFRDNGLFNDIYNDFFDPDDDYESLREGGGRVDITIMNLIGFDASAVGNHEFDNGPDAFESIIEEDFDDNDGTEDDRWVGAQFPYLSANLDFSGDGDLGNLFTDQILFNTEFITGPEESDAGNSGVPKLAPSTVIEVNGQLVGVVGATTQLVESITSTGGVGETSSTGVNDMPALAAALQPVIDDLLTFQDGINKIVLVTHLQQIALEKELLGLLEGVDVIIAGGSDTLQANPRDILNPGDTAVEPYPYQGANADGDPALIVSTDGEYSYLGRLVVNFDDQGIVTGFNEDLSGPYATEAPELVSALGIDDVNNDQQVDYEDLKALTGVDEPIEELIDAVFDVIIAKDTNIVGFTNVFLDGRRSQVRTEETNLGSLTADANLWQARLVDADVLVSIKNGGGIRAAIGEVQTMPPYDLLPPQANPLSGKQAGEVSQLDIENSLRFNNGLSILTLSIEDLVEILEHGVAASGPGNTPGQFPQVAGVEFCFDPDLPAGERVVEATLLEPSGPTRIVENGGIVGDGSREIRVVTLNFLAGGGDDYPFDTLGANRLDVYEETLAGPDAADFAGFGTEQDALAEYLTEFFPDANSPFDQPETAPSVDKRIFDVTNNFPLQILHASDLEGGVEALERAGNFAGIVELLQRDMPTTTLSAGDNYIPGPFYNAAGDRPTFRDSGLFNDIYNDLFEVSTYDSLREGGGRVDITIMNIIGFDASAVGNHEFDNGPDAFEGIIEEEYRDPNGPAGDRWVGAQFPYLSANLDFSSDGDLGNLFTSDILPNSAFVTGPLESQAGNSSVPKLAPATTIELFGRKIGLVGATTQLLESISSNGDVSVIGPTSEDMAQLAAILQPVINDVIDGDDDLLGTADDINKVILVTHLQQIALEKQLLPLLSGIDVIIAGGSDTLQANAGDPLNPGDIAEEPYPYVGSNKDGETAYIVSTAGEYSYVGRLVVEFDKDGVVQSYDENLSGPIATENPAVVEDLGVGNEDGQGGIDYDDLKALTSTDDEVRKLVDAVFDVIIAKDGNIFGYTAVFLEGRRENVRTQETNLGNLTADANLWMAQFHDPGTVVSIKNGGGIRAAIGEVQTQPPYDLLPPQDNPLSGKQEGQVSQLDIENSLRFNNNLTLLTVTLEELIELLEHGVADSGPGNTPGRFPQVAGVRFSYDVDLPPGDRLLDVILMEGNTPRVIYEDGGFAGGVNPQSTIRLVTLGFLAGGGDSYPFPSGPAANRVDLDDVGSFGPNNATFEDLGTEQDALAEYLAANFPAANNRFSQAETAPALDRRIMNANELPSEGLLYDPAPRGGSIAYNTTVMYDPGQNYPALIISGLTPDFEVQGGIYDLETGNWIIYDYNAGRNIEVRGISEGSSREMAPVDLLILLYRDTLQPPPVPPVVTVEYGMPAPELILGAPRQIELAKFRAEATGPDDPLNVTMELDTEPGKQYVISYTSDLGELNPSGGEIGTLLAPVGEQITPPFTAGGNRFQWTDTGPPYTYSEGPSQRFYLNYREVLEIRDDRN